MPQLLDIFRRFFDGISRYPVLFFGALYKFITAKAHIETGSVDDIWLTALMLYLQSAYSVSKKTADEQIEGSKYVGAVEQQNVMHAQEIIKRTTPRKPD